MLMVFDAVYQKKRDTNVSPVIIKIYVPTLALSKSGSGSKLKTSSQPVKQAPRFIYKIQYSSVGKKCQYQYKNIFGHILESHILESDAGVTDKLYITGMLSRSGHMFL